MRRNGLGIFERAAVEQIGRDSGRPEGVAIRIRAEFRSLPGYSSKQ